MNSNPRQQWSPAMRAIWWLSSVLFGATAVMLLLIAVLAFRDHGSLDWRGLLGAAAALGGIGWLWSVKSHPEEWLDDEGKPKRSFRLWK